MLGDFLVVGIDSDERVRKLKGPDRPINNEQERKLLLENLKAVDRVEIFNTDQDLINLIADCDLMIKGSDYRGQPIIGEEVCPSIEYFERLNEFSTTKKIKSIRNR